MKIILFRQDSSTNTPKPTKDRKDYVQVRSQAIDRATQKMMAIIGGIAENTDFARMPAD